MTTLRRTAVLATSLLLAAAMLAGAAPASAESTAPTTSVRTLPEPPGAAEARVKLAQLVITAEDDVPGYTRAKFPHWITQFGTCNTREVVLARDGQGVEQDAQCRAVSGTWYSEYDGKTVTTASGIDIDHIVPLKEAWRSGASGWTTAQRQAFANDLTRSQLIAVSAGSNRSKGDKDPARWTPMPSYWCTYGRAWVSIKAAYRLTADQPEVAALEQMLNSCDG